MVRSLKIINQVIWPPIITTLLYVFVFGLAIGSRIPSVQGVSYAQFLIPGLIMLQVIDSSYGECSSSLFQGRFMNSIQELLIAPMSALRDRRRLRSRQPRALAADRRADHRCSASCSCTPRPRDWLLYFVVIALVSMLFSALGLIFGLIADKFDHIAILTTFVITPLTFVGGVFTSATMLPPALRNFELFNPIFYTIDAFRRSYTGQSYLAPAFSIGMVALLTAISLRSSCE